MRLKKILFLVIAAVAVNGCVSQDIRIPSSLSEVYANTDIQEGLKLAASQNVLFMISPDTLTEFQKTEVDSKCYIHENPFWPEKLSVYLNMMRRRPELLSKFHVLEIKKGDSALAQIQKDLDGGSVLSIQYVMTESRGRVTFKSQLPCDGNLAELLGKDLVKTDFDFPSMEQVEKTLDLATERAETPRFKFRNSFITYLAERGAILKFNHEQSFEKNNQGQYILAEVMNKLSDDLQATKNLGYVDLWFRKINQNSKQAELIQMFSLINDKDINAGLKTDSHPNLARKNAANYDLTYLFVTYKSEGDEVVTPSLAGLNTCLKNQAKVLGSNFLGTIFRTPASKITGTDSSSRIGDTYQTLFNCENHLIQQRH